MKTALYLDNTKIPIENIPGYHPWIVVKNYNEFTEYIIANGIPDLISFDHDLAKEHIDDYFKQFAEKGFQHPDYESYTEKTGLDCAKFVVEYCQRMNTSLKYCSVHSANPVGAQNIQSFINGFKRHMDETEDCFLMKAPYKIEKKD